MHQRLLVWKAKIMPKVKYFIWRLLSGLLPACVELIKKGIQVNNICPMCGEQDESPFHIFFACTLSSGLDLVNQRPKANF